VKLATRLWLLGAAVPVLGVVLALVLAGQLYEIWLARVVDQALLSQAAAEAVSLFDGPGGEPHLHLEHSPLTHVVRAFAPVAEVYGPDGRRVLSFPSTAVVASERLVPPSEDAPPLLETVREGDVPMRRLTVRVVSPAGVPHLLRLSTSLAWHEAAVRAFQGTTLGMAALLGLVFFGLQTWQARWLERRLRELRGLIVRLREGVLSGSASEGATRDEVAEVESALREAAGRLGSAREAQEQLIARAAHELRTPLALMRTHLDLALWKERDAAELRASLEETRREVERLSALAGNLLDLASFGRGTWEVQRADLGVLLEDASAAARAQAEEQGVWVTVEAPRPAVCSFHSSSMRQALDNLLANALRFAPRGTEITLRAERRESLWRVSVRDGGPGIPTAHREKVFTPFYRVESSGPGTGLGLAVVEEVARRHGGRAYVAETQGPGAELVMELPDAGTAAVSLHPA
jgi:signal transduction histidine kinase